MFQDCKARRNRSLNSLKVVIFLNIILNNQKMILLMAGKLPRRIIFMCEHEEAKLPTVTALRKE